MLIQFTEEQKMLQGMAHEFSLKEIAPRDRWMDENGFDHELYRKIAENGYMGINIPEEYGGSGGSAVETCIILNEFAKGSASEAAFLDAHWMAADLVLYHGTDEQKRKYLPQASEGKIFAFGLTEASAGSDAAGIKSTAQKQPDGSWLLNGSKAWITNSGVADFGGQGMLLIGKFLAMAALLDDKHVSWLPSYGPEMRGGTANCSVIISDDEVGSPLVDMADGIVAMNAPSLDKFENKVRPGGVLVVNSSIVERKVARDDITVIYCDATRIAEEVGNPKGANVAILGALLEKCPIVSDDKMSEAIRIELGERKAKFLPGNMKALEAGKASARRQ